MRWRLWLTAVGGMAAGYLWYRWVQHSVEGGMRRHLEAPMVPAARPPAAPPEPEETTADGGSAPGSEARLLAVIRERPGVLQTELYDLFPEENRRTLQDLLLQLDRKGEIRRDREGSTYRLEIAEAGRPREAKS